MTQRSGITPSGWLAIALALYIILFGLAYEFFRNRSNADVPTTTPTTSVSADANLNSDLPSIDPITGLAVDGGTNVVALPLLNEPSDNRATILYPLSGSVIQDDDGWLEVQGRLQNALSGERFFIVIESPGTTPPIVYPQQELTVSASGEWTAQVRYGSPGQSYRTYVIATSDATAVEALFSHEALAGLPNGFEIVSNVNVNAIQ